MDAPLCAGVIGGVSPHQEVEMEYERLDGDDVIWRCAACRRDERIKIHESIPTIQFGGQF
jgi:hypothetical protein